MASRLGSGLWQGFVILEHRKVYWDLQKEQHRREQPVLDEANRSSAAAYRAFFQPRNTENPQVRPSSLRVRHFKVSLFFTVK